MTRRELTRPRFTEVEWPAKVEWPRWEWPAVEWMEPEWSRFPAKWEWPETAIENPDSQKPKKRTVTLAQEALSNEARRVRGPPRTRFGSSGSPRKKGQKRDNRPDPELFAE